MRFLLNLVHDNYPAFIVGGIIAFLAAVTLLTMKGTAPISDNIGEWNKEMKYADVLVYDGQEVNAAMVTSIVKDHYADGYTIMVDAVTVSTTNYNTLNLGTNTKYNCTVTESTDGISKVTFTKKP